MNTDYADQAVAEKQYEQTRQQWNAYLNAVVPGTPRTLAELSRAYPSMNPELGAAIAYSGMAADDPMVHQILELDNQEQGRMGSWLGPITRPLTGLAYDIFDNTLPRGIRFWQNIAQGDGITEAIMTSGSSIGEGSIADYKATGNVPGVSRMFGSTGLMAGQGEDPALHEGSSEILAGYMGQGYEPAQAIDYTREWQAQNDSGTIFDESRSIAESTMLHATLDDGRTVAYHSTPGRSLMNSVGWLPGISHSDPDSFMFKAVSGTTDAVAQIRYDPLNPFFDRATDIARARKTAVRARDISSVEEANSVARSFGGASLDEEIPFAMHGTALIDDLEGGAVTRGGIGNDFTESGGLATGGNVRQIGEGDGSLYVIDPAGLPDDVKALYYDGDLKRVEQIFPAEAAAKIFPDMEPTELFNEARKFRSANKYLEDDTLYQVFKEYDEDAALLADQIDNLADDIATGADPETILIDGDEFRTIEEVRAVVAEWDDSEILLEAIDGFVESKNVLDTSPFSRAANLTPEQADLVKRMAIMDQSKEFVFGADDLPITPKVKFSADEVRDMERMGFAFDSREGFESYKGWLDEVAEMGGVQARGKWLVNPARWETWIDSTRGNRFVGWAQEAGYSQLKRKLVGMSEDNLWRLHKTADPEEITQILKQWYGSPNSRYTVPVRSRSANALSATQLRLGNGAAKISGSTWRRTERLSRYGRRLSAEMGHSSIDPYDADVTFDYVTSVGRLLGKSDGQIDNTLSWLDEVDVRKDSFGKNIEGLRERARYMQDEIFEWMKQDLVVKGHDAEYADEVIDTWRQASIRNQQYAENANAMPLEMRRAPGRRLRNGEGDELDLMAGDPILDSQLSQRHYFMPSVREVRRMTAKVRKMTEARRANSGRSVIGLGTSKSQKVVDGMMAGWRNLALLRLGWMMRVLPDEIARMYVSGYSDIMTNPLSYILYSAGKKGNYLDETTLLHQIEEAQGLGADNGLFRGIDDQAYIETSQRGASWNRVRATSNGYTLTAEGARGVSRRFIQLNQSELARSLYDHATVEDALRFLRDNVDDNNVLTNIWKAVDPDSTLGRAVARGEDGERQLRSVLEAIDAQRHQFTGGSWVGKDRNGSWVDMNGDSVQLYDFDKDTLVGMAQERGLTIRGTKQDIRSRLLADDGLPPDLYRRSEAYIVTQRGQPELLDVMRHGQMQGTPNPNRAQVNAGRDWFASSYSGKHTSDFVFVVRGGKMNPNGLPKSPRNTSHIYTSYDQAALRLQPGEMLTVIYKDSLPPSVLTRKATNGRIAVDATDMRRAKILPDELDGDQLRALRREAMDEGQVPLVHDSMGVDDFDEFEKFLTNAYTPDNPPPRFVTAPDRSHMNANDEKRMIDTLFAALGRNPSLFGVRRPFVTLRTWEVMAGHYVTASPAVRKAIMANADEAGMLGRFTEFVDDALEQRGMRAPVQGHSSTVDEIIELSWGHAVDDTKDLFYDLSKGGAWQDATRIVFPFADAWWEVLSRWGRLVNPAHTGGAPFKAGKRATTAWFSAESSGYFTEDEEGSRTFEIPGTASLFNAINANSPLSLSGQVSLEQLTFVDFGAPSQALKPGFAPQVQLTAGIARQTPLLQTWLPESIRDGFDSFVFGEFSPPSGLTDPYEMGSLFLPTWMRRTISRIFSDEFDENYAGLNVRFMNVYASTVGEEASTNPDMARAIQEEAAKKATLVATVDIFSSFVSPAQPRNIAELALIDGNGTEYVRSIAALATDFRQMKDIYGPQEAVEIFVRAYGFDPLKIAPAYWADERAPVTNDSWEYLKANPEIDEFARFTLMAWLPEDDGEFNIDAWRAADYEQMKPEDAGLYYSYAAGAHRLAALRDYRDEMLEDLEKRYDGSDNSGYRHMNETVIEPWYKLERANIATEYYGYDPGEGLAGVTNRPPYRIVFNELTHIGTPGTDANIAMRSANPELLGFVEYATNLWREAEKMALDMGFGHEWWQTSESESNYAPVIRESYANALSQYAGGMSDKFGATYIGQYFLAPLLTDFDWDNPVVVAPSSPSTKELGYADTIGARDNG